MEPSTKPLHVQVAEALGEIYYRPCELMPESCAGVYIPRDGDGRCVPCYDTDWSATGPLLEKYRISTGKYNPWFLGGKYYAVQRAEFASEEEALANMGPETHEATGNSTLEAVCQLLLQLHKAGKLT